MTCPPCTNDCNEGRICPARDIDPYTTQVRNQTLEEVAQHVEKMSPIVAGHMAMYIRKNLANYIREMKK